MNYGIDVLRADMNGDAVQELQIRLAGFNGGAPDGDFGPGTIKQVKQFQKDFMKMDNPSGEVDQETYEAINKFSQQFPLSFDQLKCPCGVCSGFGQGQFKGKYRAGKPEIEAYHQYEYPGMHRMILWASRAVMFYHPQYTFSINSGYRCSERNKQTNRSSTNHHGKAIDLDVPNAAGETRETDNQRCNTIRANIVKFSNAQIGWGASNKKSLEPENIAPTWVHYDVRNFASKYLEDRFFCKSLVELDQKPSGNTDDIVSTVTASPEPASTTIEGIVTASKLNVRAKPQNDGALLGQVLKNDIVKVSENKDGWCCIDFNGQTAYASQKYIQLKEDLI